MHKQIQSSQLDKWYCFVCSSTNYTQEENVCKSCYFIFAKWNKLLLIEIYIIMHDLVKIKLLFQGMQKWWTSRIKILIKRWFNESFLIDFFLSLTVNWMRRFLESFLYYQITFCWEAWRWERLRLWVYCSGLTRMYLCLTSNMLEGFAGTFVAAHPPEEFEPA